MNYSSDDDEPLPAAVRLPNVTTRAVPEHDAVAASESRPDFSVLVGIRAPPLSEDAPRHVQCAPIDLVMVLDVSSSMRGRKIDLLKMAVRFVIDNLGPSDRLSIVTFNDAARRILPLNRMTKQGRAGAIRVVDSIFVSPSTNILKGLRMGARVLEERRLRNPVASIMFLSDGADTCGNKLKWRRASDYLPPSINRCGANIHAFGFGSDHVPHVLHDISDASGGTFSFIESYKDVQAAFARCIGGLLSVVTRDLCLMLSSATHGVEIKSIPSGKHTSVISDQGSRGIIVVGDLYADEEKEFLINTSVPVYTKGGGCEDDDESKRTTSLLEITCSYKDVLSNEMVLMELVEIRRPGIPLPLDVKVKLEVDRQRNRLYAVEGFAEAQRAAEAGDLEGARAILSKKRSVILASESGQAGDGLVVKVEKEMKETEARMGCKQTYEQAGRAYALANISAHANQRATSSTSGSNDDAYVTPNMAYMVKKAIENYVKKKIK